MWNVTVQDGSDTYTYYLNICNDDEDDGLYCPDEDHMADVSACQKKDRDSWGKIIGKRNKQLLRYALYLMSV